MPSVLLDETTIQKRLQALQGWEYRNNALVKTYRFPDFSSALGLVNAVAVISEHCNHHPDVGLRFGEATFRLSTHDVGGVTEVDVELAKEIEKTAALLV
jgi:4a-hydroxytetrahydrobiopterin dehydratase